MLRRVLGAAFSAVFTCSGCASNIVQNLQSSEQVADRTDGAVMGYYLPKAIWNFAATYDGTKGLLSLASDPTTGPTILPDTGAGMRVLSYAHAGLSDDDFDVMFDGLMLKSVATKSSDQSVKVIEAANTLLTQVGTTQTALQKLAFDKLPQEGPPTLPTDAKDAGCTTDLKSQITANLSFETQTSQNDLVWGQYCSLKITLKMDGLGRRAPFGSSQDLGLMTASDVDQICSRAVCFRPSQIVQITVTVTLMSTKIDADGTKLKTPGTKSYPVRLPFPGKSEGRPMVITQISNPVTVPSAKGLAFVEFSRRAFVENHTTISFQNGVLNEFHSTDPSIATGALTLSSDLLKSVVLTVPLVR